MRKLSRRAALKGLALAAGAPATIGVTAAEAPKDVGSGPRLLVVYLRGGLDGLAAVPPHGDAHFATSRGHLAAGGVLERHRLDGLFGLHPALAPLLGFHAAGELIVLPAVSVPQVGHSHDQARAALFDGDIDAGEGNWLERAAAELSVFPLWRAHPGERSLDLAADLALGNPLVDAADLFEEPPLAPTGVFAENFVAWRIACEAARFARAARDAAESLEVPGGARVALLELSGFDTHVAQGAERGRLALAFATLAEGLEAFARSTRAIWDDMAVLVVTEFGRSVAPNAQGGTDHGDASAAFLFGGAVAGGHVLGRWPGLAPGCLANGCALASATDTRSLIRSVLAGHLGLSDAGIRRVFPAAAGIAPLPGLFRAKGAGGRRLA